MIAGKDMQREKFLLLASIHLIFLLAFIASLLLLKNNGVVVYNYFFTAFICSGIILSGLSWRSKSPVILRWYFSLFAFTLPLFLLSPSLLLNFLLTMSFSNTGSSFHLYDKYFLETQNNSSQLKDYPRYKAILKHGIFHQTIQRDIEFGGILDSVKIIENEKGKILLLRGYTSKITRVSSDVDSADVTILLKVIKQGDVEYHL